MLGVLRVKVSLIIAGEGGINNIERGLKWDSATLESCGRDITYFCERTGRIFKENIKVFKLYIRKDFCPESKRNISWFAHVQLLVGSTLLKGKGRLISLEIIMCVCTSYLPMKNLIW